MPVQPALIAAPQCHAMAVEELKDLDRDLASIVETVAQLCGDELAVLGMRRDVGYDLNHFSDGAAQEKVIRRDLVNLAHAAEQLEQPAHLALLHGEHP